VLRLAVGRSGGAAAAPWVRGRSRERGGQRGMGVAPKGRLNFLSALL